MLHGAAKLKANWSCTICGMYSSRRYSVQRHINNIHSGKGDAIPFVEYLVGRRTGQYEHTPKPNFISSDSTLDKMKKEAEQIFIKRVVEQSLPSPGDPAYAELAKSVRMFLAKRALNELRDSMQQEFSASLESGGNPNNSQ